MCSDYKSFKGAKDIKKLMKELGIDVGYDGRFPEERYDEIIGESKRITDDILTIKLKEQDPVFSIMGWSINWNAKQPIFNSRIETIKSEKRWTDIFRNARCLIPADAFYEFRPFENDPPETVKYKKERKIKRKTKFEISLPDEPGFVIGGIYIHNKGAEFCSMITTEAHKDLKQIPHHRCPYLMNYRDALEFLQADPDYLLDNIKPYPNDKHLEIKQVSEI